ncbi:hypothetical protein Aglo01_31220 [Actinokineospora globicatena]|nr:hypothetical protein Aglo01_31220 [Actinokineospora globicatena]GLW84692.1 hypothetical protein Aglo02_23320 [Actinokineospora globicatena]
MELCSRGDRSVSQLAKGFALSETAVRQRVVQAERTRTDGLATDEREELMRPPPVAGGRGDAPRVRPKPAPRNYLLLADAAMQARSDSLKQRDPKQR